MTDSRAGGPGIFRRGGRLDLPLIALFAAIHAILLVNAIAHEPGIGYDARDHLGYIEAFSSFNLPSPDQTTEFFSPPLPYLAPSILRRFGLTLWGAAKGAQLLNVLFSMLLCVSLLKICEEVRPGDGRLKLWSLALLGMLPVYYRSFALVRGEPLLAAIAVFVAYRMLRLMRPGGATRDQAVSLGLGIGVMILARQWGFFMLPALVVFAAIVIARSKSVAGPMARAVAVALIVGALSGGWFYFISSVKYGSITAFNRDDRSGFSTANQPASFYVGLGDGALFTHPVRPSFPNQLIPTFYADVWGDYWCYFDLYAIDRKAGRLLSGVALVQAIEDPASHPDLVTNFDSMSRYLGRVNLVSLLPCALLIVGFAVASAAPLRLLRGDAPAGSPAVTLVFLSMLFSLGGYFWFLISYLSLDKGEAIKGTYILQIFPFACILGGLLAARIAERWPRAGRALAWVVALCALHNLPVLFTRMTILY